SSSEDEWEEMELVDTGEIKGKNVQVTVEDPGKKDFKSLWMRREVNRCIREKWENCHRVNILCYIAHLQYLKNQTLDGNFIPSLMLSTIVLENIAKLKEKYSSLCVTAQMNRKGKGVSKKKASSGTDSQIMIQGGVRDVTARYAGQFSRSDFRRRRTDPKWLARTLGKGVIRANRKRARLEDTHLQKELVNKPLPTTLSEYKNHPLYVLEKDLLKFEAIYPRPEDQKPLGVVRGHKVYPRSSVHTLQGANNWIKQARSVKEGEKPYKVVKGRPNLRVPAEMREQRYLEVYGYWQTEPYRPPKVMN
ncbi:DNA repair protein Rad4, partial [Teladorsagia circumcincta]